MNKVKHQTEKEEINLEEKLKLKGRLNVRESVENLKLFKKRNNTTYEL